MRAYRVEGVRRMVLASMKVWDATSIRQQEAQVEPAAQHNQEWRPLPVLPVARRGVDPNMAVGDMCRHYAGRELQPGDIILNAQSGMHGGHQTLVALHSFEDEEFFGESAGRRKEAEAGALRQILRRYPEWIECVG